MFECDKGKTMFKVKAIQIVMVWIKQEVNKISGTLSVSKQKNINLPDTQIAHENLPNIIFKSNDKYQGILYF